MEEKELENKNDKFWKEMENSLYNSIDRVVYIEKRLSREYVKSKRRGRILKDLKYSLLRVRNNLRVAQKEVTKYINKSG